MVAYCDYFMDTCIPFLFLGGALYCLFNYSGKHLFISLNS
jgi:hypothetical protein